MEREVWAWVEAHVPATNAAMTRERGKEGESHTQRGTCANHGLRYASPICYAIYLHDLPNSSRLSNLHSCNIYTESCFALNRLTVTRSMLAGHAVCAVRELGPLRGQPLCGPHGAAGLRHLQGDRLTHPPIHSLTHSLTPSRTHPPTLPLTHSFTHSITR